MLNQETKYPYIASPGRAEQIFHGVNKVSVGMPLEAVKVVLGDPDEINPTYDSIMSKTATKIGYSFVFLIQRKSKSGSAIEKDEKLVRVHFSLNDKVSRVDRIGF